MTPNGPSQATPKRIGKTPVVVSVAVLSLMFGLAFASAPLYRMFCAATGYGGTTQVAKVAPSVQGERTLVVRFDANVAPGLPWKFEAETASITLRTGQTATVFFKLTNTAARPTAGTAMYNVSPDVSGAYFNKLECFCFDEKKLGPNESMDVPLVFFLDPALEKDESMARVDSLTLSYTFFGSKAPVAANAEGAKDKAKL